MEERVDIILKQTITESVTVNPQLQAKIAQFVDFALDEAMKELRFGLGTNRMKILTMVLSGAVRSQGKDFTSTENEARVGLEQLFASMRDDAEPPPRALTPGTHDPDEIAHD